MKKTILILNDRFPLRDTQINLGDSALSIGLYQVLQNSMDCEIISGGWKNFPYFNMHRFRREKSYPNIESIFNKWLGEVTDYSAKRVEKEKSVSNFLDKSILFKNPLFNRIEGTVKARFSRGLVETIKPFILRKYYSHKLIEKLKKADLVLYSGAALVSDRFSFYLPMGMFECFLAKKLNKKVVAANQTIDIDDPLNFSLVSSVYRMMDLHITREPLSKKRLLNMGVDESKVITSCDPALVLNIKGNEGTHEIEEREGIGQGNVGLIIRGDNPAVDYDTWVRIINYIRLNYGKKVFLLFTCIAHDYHVYRKLSKRCNISRLSRFYDLNVLINLMRKFDLIITDRYHAAIFAILAHTPVLPVSPQYKTEKTEGLFALFDYPVKVLPHVGDDTYDQLTKNISYLVKKKEEIREILSKARVDLKNRCENDYRVLSKIVEVK